MSWDYTAHALTVMRERVIERVAAVPEMREPDPEGAALERRYGRFAEAGGRVLRVVVNRTILPERVGAAHFGRKMEKRL